MTNFAEYISQKPATAIFTFHRSKRRISRYRDNRDKVTVSIHLIIGRKNFGCFGEYSIITPSLIL